MESNWKTIPAVLREPKIRPLFVMQLQVAPALSVGTTASGPKRVAIVKGGQVSSDIPGLAATVHPGGSDWLTEKRDGSLHLDARIVLETSGGDQILMSYTGIRHGSVTVMQDLAAGKELPADAYYFRISPRFETASQPLDWLNRVVAFGIGQRLADGVRYSLFEVS
ncbi:DUF3237 domain-containing protein [Neorhizobium galegae]|uniref:DUF3237 domain-containing protein n=1 Tax=Neorhizobium galegae TaxID=399 RepID=UPI003D7ABE63